MRGRNLVGVLPVLAVASAAIAQTSQLVTPRPSTVRQCGPMALGDFDSDGLPDLVIGNYEYLQSSAMIAVHRNLSRQVPGLFDAGLALTAANGANLVEPADLDGDGRLDVICASGLEGAFCHVPQTLQVFLNNSPQASLLSFAASPAQSLNYKVMAIEYADFLPAAGREVALLDGCGNAVRFYAFASSPAPRFTEIANVAVGSSPIVMESADLDSDGDIDLVTGNSQSTTVLYNLGSGTFFAHHISLPASNGVAVADVDGDGRLDLALATDGSDVPVRLCRHVAVGSFLVSDLAMQGGCCAYPARVAFGDIDGDVYPDLIYCRNGVGSGLDAMVRLGTGSAPWFGPAAQFAQLASHGANASQHLAVADLDGVGGDDLVRTLPFFPSSQIEVWRNTTPQVGRPFPGSGRDFELTTVVVGLQRSLLLGGQPVKNVAVGDTVTVHIRSPRGTFVGQTAFLGAQVFPTSTLPSPTFPSLGLHFDMGRPLFMLFNGLDQPYPPPLGQGGLPAPGIYTTFVVPPGVPAALSILLQGFVFGSPGSAATDGHELRT
ncbi:MAG: VCBS repeat-containing protein [Planctomycetes bacterium]|nr:VCBS repeat-containing protein [Planctomycetota bacterium]